ncbi:PRAME family member 10-like [Apodemus sylvaticus]|uniref:PRAME family member 10-like n=1 Tax=Apodemus sylvaticus TaxID=10129 RepID=UPI002241C3EF|nr:PRAME family member 10-like [Apodemus sylvaticus]
MGVQTPSTLLKLARKALLRDEALAISAIEELPRELFPELFKEAFAGRHTKLIKSMVGAWPFPYLPVGALMTTPNMETFQAVLDGVDMRLKRTFHPRRPKLQILDLRNVHHAFWHIWDGEEECEYSTETVDKKEVVNIYRPVLREDPLHHLLPNVTVRLGFFFLLSEALSAQTSGHERHNIIELGYYASPSSSRKCGRHFAVTGLKGLLGSSSAPGITRSHGRNKWRPTWGSRCLMLLLETLSIAHYHFSHLGFHSFSFRLNLFLLTHLDMRVLILYALDLTPLRGLLEKVADSLETLDLKGCRMKDSQLNALLLALRQCSHLFNVNFYNNHFSMPILKKLLLHQASCSSMNVEQYPAP